MKAIINGIKYEQDQIIVTLGIYLESGENGYVAPEKGQNDRPFTSKIITFQQDIKPAEAMASMKETLRAMKRGYDKAQTAQQWVGTVITV